MSDAYLSNPNLKKIGVKSLAEVKSLGENKFKSISNEEKEYIKAKANAVNAYKTKKEEVDVEV